jgi:hypothetical protein
VTYFVESFRQLTTAITIPISAVIGPVIDQVVVLLIWLPPSTPNPWSAQIRPNSTSINPSVSVTTKVLLISESYPRFGHSGRCLIPAGNLLGDRGGISPRDRLKGVLEDGTRLELL